MESSQIFLISCIQSTGKFINRQSASEDHCWPNVPTIINENFRHAVILHSRPNDLEAENRKVFGDAQTHTMSTVFNRKKRYGRLGNLFQARMDLIIAHVNSYVLIAKFKLSFKLVWVLNRVC
jgi:hypothetical protein